MGQEIVISFLPEIIVLGQVILIDVSLSGDNAVVIGMAAAGLEQKQRKLAIFYGTLFAIAIRVLLSLVTVSLLRIPYVMSIGGVLLLWVSWKMFSEITGSNSATPDIKYTTTLRHAVTQIVIADLSMSLDNILAVAGAAKQHPIILAFGLILSIGFMAVAANFIATILDKWPHLKYIGLGLIVYVAISMIVKSFLA